MSNFERALGTLLLSVVAASAADSGAAENRIAVDANLGARLPSTVRLTTVSVHDPVYKGVRRYRGYPLADVLRTMPAFKGRTPEGRYVKLVCRDGYAPVISVQKAMSGSAVIAMRSLSATAPNAWEPIQSNTGTSTPDPAYLVWTGADQQPDEYPWPYQIVSIELVDASAALPPGDEKSKHGRDLFALHCSKCHTVNGIGGTMGPELNVPCNVTEYWRPASLAKFVKDPTAVRRNSRMPAFPNLTESDIAAILEYLTYMGGHKNTAATACR